MRVKNALVESTFSRIPDTYSPKETTAYMKYLHCLIGHNVLYFQFRPTLLTNVWNLKQFSAKNLIILVNFGLKSAIFNLVLGPVHVIWAEVISVTEKTFRQVYKRDLALL